MVYAMHMMIGKPKVQGVRVQLTETQVGGSRKSVTLYGWTAKEVLKVLTDAYEKNPKQIKVQTAESN